MKWLGDALEGFSSEELDRDDFDWEALDAAEAHRWAEYQVHLAALLPELPAGLRCFRSDGEGDWVATHDAMVEWWSDASPDAFTLGLLCSTPLGGSEGARALARHERVVVQYTGRVTVTGATSEQVRTWLDEPQTEILREELDRAEDGGFEQRFRLWPHAEFGVRFDDAVVVRATVDADVWDEVTRRRHRERARLWRGMRRGYDAAEALGERSRVVLSNAHFAFQQRLGRG